jgi:hypothetical protein
MSEGFHDSILEGAGFQKIGSLRWEFPLDIFWHPKDFSQVSVVGLNPYSLVKATKSYLMRAITPEGEVYSRDLPALHQALESYFKEVHISSFFMRDVTPELALRRIREKRMRDTGKADTHIDEKESILSNIRNRYGEAKERLADTNAFMELAGNDSSLLESYLRMEHRRRKKEMEELKVVGRRLEEEVLKTKKLLREYERKGYTTAFVISFSSILHATWGREDFQDAFNASIREIRNAHTYHIHQKLAGGKLHIYLEEVQHPLLALQAEWASGVLNPNQLASLGSHFDELRQKVEEYHMVFPSSDIQLDTITKDQKKLVTAKFLQNLISRLDKVSPIPHISELPTEGGWIGHVMEGDTITPHPLLYPLRVEHIYDSGTTRYGKSYLGRVLVENALIEGTNVLILDRTRQWCGLGKPANDEGVLIRFDTVGIGRKYVRGFPTKIFTPGNDVGLALPEDPKELFTGCSVICLKGLTDSESCTVARDILQAIYDSFDRESDRVELLVVLEEASTFLPGDVSKEAKEVAKEVRSLISRIAREKAKYGCVFLIITQSQSDFKDDAKIVREMVGARFFLRATDRAEHDYIEQYVSREAAEIIKKLRAGEAFVHSATVAGAKCYVRAPFSAVSEMSNREIEQINQRQQSSYRAPDNDTIREMYEHKLTVSEKCMSIN